MEVKKKINVCTIHVGRESCVGNCMYQVTCRLVYSMQCTTVYIDAFRYMSMYICSATCKTHVHGIVSVDTCIDDCQELVHVYQLCTMYMYHIQTCTSLVIVHVQSLICCIKYSRTSKLKTHTLDRVLIIKHII